MMTPKSLEKLITETRANLDALERVAALMNGHAKNGKVHRAEAVLNGALKADAERRHRNWGGARRKQKPTHPSSKPGSPAAMKQRKLTERTLAHLASKGYDQLDAKERARLAPLARYGYIKKQGDAYIRTDKVFTP